MRICFLLLLVITPLTAPARVYITIIQGLGGNDNYARQFDEQTKITTTAAAQITDKDRVTVLAGTGATRKNILAHFEKLQKSVTAGDRTVLFLFGHGSYDGQQYKFNIPGPDLTGDDLGEILKASRAKQQLLVNTSSASGAVLKELQSDSRIIITATRNGNERNAPRFGNYFVAALSDHSADTNKNESISAEEAFTYAERLTQDYYKKEGRLATEHPQLEGKLAGQFNIARLVSIPEETANPAVAGLIKQRQEIDQKIDDLQSHKDEFQSSEDYYTRLQDLLLQLSLLDEQIDKLKDATADDSEDDQP